MKLSDDKISYLTHFLFQRLEAAGELLKITKDDVTVRGLVKRAIQDQLVMEEKIEEKVSEKIRSQSRSIPEGGREWEVLFEKYLEEEWDKLSGE